MVNTALVNDTDLFFVEEDTLGENINSVLLRDQIIHRSRHRLNMEVDLQSLFGLHVT
jgi:hypothetical protein